MLANVANISHITIARIEMGTIDPRISTLKALAKALNVKISALVD
ncbi:MAG: helix-turn-helix transcriptional regulator [Nitrospira sp.]|nr:helix-turn-helix transcriptional regulator [Nitrospira sp.]